MRAETPGPVGSPRYVKYLTDIIDSSKHLLGVINDILDVAKSEAGKLELNEQRVNVVEEIQLTARLFSEQAATVEVSLEIDVPDTLPPLWANQRKIRQVLLNLVSNAVKFTPPGGRVTIAADITADGGMDIAVIDTGIGISKDDLEAAFETFGQVESSLSKRYAGTGLSLPLARAGGTPLRQARARQHPWRRHLHHLASAASACSEIGATGSRLPARWPSERFG